MIEIRELHLRYPGAARSVLESTDLTIPDAAVTYLLGLNGAGKSTLLRSICGIVAPAAGTIRVDGTEVRAHRATPPTLGMHLDYRAYDPRHTARRHLRWIARARGVPPSRVPEVVDMVDMGPVVDRRLGEYSLGMLQRIGIAAALLSKPRTLLLDEPLNGLDIAGILWMRALLRRLAEAGTCVLVTSHLLDEVQRNADRVIVLGGRRVLVDAALPELFESVPAATTLEDVYVSITGLGSATGSAA